MPRLCNLNCEQQQQPTHANVHQGTKHPSCRSLRTQPAVRAESCTTCIQTCIKYHVEKSSDIIATVMGLATVLCTHVFPPHCSFAQAQEVAMVLNHPLSLSRISYLHSQHCTIPVGCVTSSVGQLGQWKGYCLYILDQTRASTSRRHTLHFSSFVCGCTLSHRETES